MTSHSKKIRLLLTWLGRDFGESIQCRLHPLLFNYAPCRMETSSTPSLQDFPDCCLLHHLCAMLGAVSVALPILLNPPLLGSSMFRTGHDSSLSSSLDTQLWPLRHVLPLWALEKSVI